MQNDEAALWSVLEAVNQWIRFADAKAGATLAVSAAIGSFVAFEVDLNQAADLLALSVLSLLAAIGALVLALLALAPITKARERLQTTLYFKDVAVFPTAEAYRDAFLAAHESGAHALEIAHQVRENSRIADYKFHKIRIAIWLVGAQLLFAVITFLVGIIRIGAA